MSLFEEARREIQQAIECKKPYGHAAQPWKTWKILHNLEQAEGNEEAAEILFLLEKNEKKGNKGKNIFFHFRFFWI